MNTRIYLVKAHSAQRQEVFRNFSKSIRGQLEVAKRVSKVCVLSGATRTIYSRNIKNTGGRGGRGLDPKRQEPIEHIIQGLGNR